ncbi:MAG: FtsW/RodA/SpoVE family cell cycle protein [Chloroflexi bacterium]|nr:FtsW/RodA/SpoVE family cell cycle protein [Chloroflexota bacterium]
MSGQTRRTTTDNRRMAASVAAAPPLPPSRPGNNPRTAASKARPRPSARETLAAAVTSRGLDYPLIGIMAILLAVGLVMVYSASFVRAPIVYKVAPEYFFIRQIIWLLVGIVVLIVMARIPYHFWQRMAIPVLVGGLVLLIVVLILGSDRFGAIRQLINGSGQPSEFVKLALVIYVAAWVASKGKDLTQVEGGLIPFALLMGLVAGLIVLERSLSVAIIVLITGVIMFFVGGGDAKQITVTGIIALVVVALLIWTSPYRAERVHDWVAMLSDPRLGSEDMAKIWEILRRGNGIGTNLANWFQKGSVPLLWSDYLFANICADLGFAGAASVVGLFAALGYRGLSIALNAKDKFASLTAIGITVWIMTQAVIHIGASLALIPSTGIPLPFMSYGGSALVAGMAGIGLLLSISRASPEKKRPYADFALGWRDGGTRLPDPGRGERAGTERRTTDDRRRTTDDGRGTVERPTRGRR